MRPPEQDHLGWCLTEQRIGCANGIITSRARPPPVSASCHVQHAEKYHQNGNRLKLDKWSGFCFAALRRGAEAQHPQAVPYGSSPRRTSQTIKFTRKERDPETELDFFEARYFSSAQGRFMSADPARLPHDISDPQSWRPIRSSNNCAPRLNRTPRCPRSKCRWQGPQRYSRCRKTRARGRQQSSGRTNTSSALAALTRRDSLRFMPTDHIVALLIAERDRLSRAIEVLQGPTKRRGRPPKNPLAAAVSAANAPAPAVPAKKKRTFSAAQRKAQAKRMKAYWAAKKNAK